MAEELVTLEWRVGVALVTLNDARHRNILTADLVRAIDEAFGRAEAHESTRCIVLTGAGTAFCAGADLATLRGAADGDFDSVERVYLGFLRVRESSLPTIAAVNGPAVGAGFNLALACDVRLAGPGARFDSRFATLRLHPGGGHAWMLAHVVGAQQAMLACLFGEVWDAQAAREVGLVAAVIGGDRLVEEAVALGQRLATQEKGFVQRLVATLRDTLSPVGHTPAMAAETEAQRWSAGRPAFRDGVRAIEQSIAARR